MLAAQRRAEIVSLLHTSGAVSVTELAARFQVSDMTIRRDLDHLAAHGLIYKVHGGAVTPPKWPQGPSSGPTGSPRAVVLADHCKWNTTALGTFAEVAQIDTLITDTGPGAPDDHPHQRAPESSA